MCSLWAFFPVGDTKSQPFAAIIEANRMFPKAFQDVAMLLRQLLPNPLPLRPCPHMGQTQEQENKSGLTLAKSSTFYIDCFTPYTCDRPPLRRQQGSRLACLHTCYKRGCRGDQISDAAEITGRAGCDNAYLSSQEHSGAEAGGLLQVETWLDLHFLSSKPARTT